MAYLLDTNVLSELRKGSRCDAKVKAWALSTVGERHCISVLSLGEIRKGIEILRRKAPDQCASFERWLALLDRDYGDKDIIPIAENVVDAWGRLMAMMSLPAIDSLIAATAIEYDLTVVTRNLRDFQRTGVSVINPFESDTSGKTGGLNM